MPGRRRRKTNCPECKRIKCPKLVKKVDNNSEVIAMGTAQWNFLPFPKSNNDELRKAVLNPELNPTKALMMRRKVIFNMRWKKVESLGIELNNEFIKVDQMVSSQNELPRNIEDIVNQLQESTQKYYIYQNAH